MQRPLDQLSAKWQQIVLYTSQNLRANRGKRRPRKGDRGVWGQSILECNITYVNRYAVTAAQQQEEQEAGTIEYRNKT